MVNLDELRREIEKLQERNSRLSSAILRINSILEVNTVLHEVVESARVLTRARCGVIVTIDYSWQIQDYVPSGYTSDKQQRLEDWADGLRLIEHFRNIPETLRLCDLPAYVRSLRFSPDRSLPKTFQCTPMRHRGVHVGTFFLGEKEGGREFTSEDEEMLVMFGAQAATAIANARTHRDEQRVRADLEALVDTSPVGVAVFDARTGKPVSFNREVNRIVESLRTPDRSPEQLLEIITCRRADGQEFYMEKSPLAQTLSTATTVRAEEIVLQVPDGRSVTTLVNVTPIRSEDGIVDSVVVTLQDLAPIQELERLRSEFLGMVTHELRAPLTSIKGSAAAALVPNTM